MNRQQMVTWTWFCSDIINAVLIRYDCSMFHLHYICCIKETE